MKKLFQIIGASLLIFLSLFMLESKSFASSLDFDVQPVGKEHEALGYFQMDTKPGSTITVPVKIENVSDEKINVKVSYLNALTSNYGNIQYVDKTELGNSSLLDSQYGLAKYITGDTLVELEKGESKTVKYSITVPSTVTKGTILGGLSFKKADRTSNSEDDKGIKINNEVERVIGIQLNLGEPEKVPVSLQDDIELIENSSPPFINIGLENKNPSIVDGVSVKYTVTKGKEEVFQGEVLPFKMAPKTKFKLPIEWGSKFASGEYQIKVSLDVNGETVEKNFSLNVTNKDVSSSENIIDVTQKDGTESPLYLTIIPLIIGLILGFVLFWFVLFWKKKKRKRKEEETAIH
ncbi:WxL protein peptidoglycan domain-containing protein [Bacillus sp. Au-Bac7]|uniref:WxL protein peptidoglycan domain-containing protein n=1 Tax=Bacillus sp. Au-Bac7 TaxID=2906458 RepID=UPI001E399012|nr:DUF916 domain-containing protein [Bacillus sp. Au-Bac7]MCE4051684.1 DUF916 and DUF3324 domain-containing protein [Bacillus sp. Au-Bac7]